MNSNHTSSQLRFAALIRVSTEKQEREGESLRVQENAINEAVAILGGEIVARYGGQEHATAGHERKELDRLLDDSATNAFDAVMVAHADRWSCDNAQSEKGLERFREHNIRFFVGNAEYDLYKPEVRLFLGLSAVVGEYHARQQNLKSMQSGIQRARDGRPTCGKLPYGR